EVCGNENQLNLTFGSGGSGNIPCPPVSQNLIAPDVSFDIFAGEEGAGTWKLLVSDGYQYDGGTLNGWTLELCRGVPQTQPLDVVITNSTDIACNGGNTGSIQATIVGGAPNYDITWSNGAKQLTLNGLTAGTYSVTVEDGTGATATTSTTLSAPAALALEDVVENVSCHDGNDGSIKVFPSGGAGNFQYQWANGVRQFDNLNLSEGNYRVTVTDGNNCTINRSFTVTEPTPIELTFSSTNAQNGANGSVALAVTGGTGDYDFDWSSGATTRNIDDLAPGTFTVVVTDQNGCTQEGQVSVATENTNTDSCYNVTVNITLDNYGEENEWEIKDGNGNIVATMGPFNNFENGSVQATTLCLPPGCYDFTIFDLWGDGMCCSYGQGGYEVIEDVTGKVLASGGSFAKSTTENFCVPTENTGNAVIEYCGAQGRQTTYEWIQTVEIAGQTFDSGDDGGYGDYSDTEVVASIGGTLDLAFTPAFGFFEYHENWQVWIDFNGDGDFEDDGEDIFFISGNSRVTGTIGIPATATAGSTRMRIAMKWGELIEPCESFSWGEVEDYTLVLSNGTTIADRKAQHFPEKQFSTGQPAFYTTQIRENILDLTVFPNPATDLVGIEWEDTAEKVYQLSIYNSLGQVQKHLQIPTQQGANKATISVVALPTGVYLITLQKGDKMITQELVVTH
ncbi:MAG: GEVED domain-containing protein, partial [Bacteroidota bacterium]